MILWLRKYKRSEDCEIVVEYLLGDYFLYFQNIIIWKSNNGLFVLKWMYLKEFFCCVCLFESRLRERKMFSSITALIIQIRCYSDNSGADPEVRHSHTEESVLNYIRKHHKGFTLLMMLQIRAQALYYSNLSN